jgi:agmatinase
MNFLPSPKAFLGLDSKDMVDSQKVKAIIVPFGLENSVSYQGGTSFGPQAIIKASHEVELFDEYFWKEPFRDFGIATLEEPKISQNLPQALRQLENITEEILQQNKFPMILGGEHSITAGSIRPFAKRFKDLVILHFDAHADLRDGYQGEHYSHASAMRRCLDDKEVYNNGSHIELISFGIRNISVSEIPFLEQNSHRIHLNFAKDKKIGI